MCESVPVSPWPGKCLPTASTPSACNPSANATPNAATVAGSEPNERMPMTGLSGLLLTSRSGARSMLMPTATSSAAMARAMRRAFSTSPVAATAIALGNSVKPLASFRRATRPPSWSMAMSSGGSPFACAAACKSAVSWASSSGEPTLRSKRMMPPTCSSVTAAASSGVRRCRRSRSSWPGLPFARASCGRESADIGRGRRGHHGCRRPATAAMGEGARTGVETGAGMDVGVVIFAHPMSRAVSSSANRHPEAGTAG